MGQGFCGEGVALATAAGVRGGGGVRALVGFGFGFVALGLAGLDG